MCVLLDGRQVKWRPWMIIWTNTTTTIFLLHTYDQEDLYYDFNDDGHEQDFDNDLMDDNVEDYSYGDFDDYD